MQFDHFKVEILKKRSDYQSYPGLKKNYSGVFFWNNIIKIYWNPVNVTTVCDAVNSFFHHFSKYMYILAWISLIFFVFFCNLFLAADLLFVQILTIYFHSLNINICAHAVQTWLSETLLVEVSIIRSSIIGTWDSRFINNKTNKSIFDNLLINQKTANNL